LILIQLYYQCYIEVPEILCSLLSFRITWVDTVWQALPVSCLMRVQNNNHIPDSQFNGHPALPPTTRTHQHTYTQTHMHTYTHTHKHTCTHTHKHTTEKC